MEHKPLLEVRHATKEYKRGSRCVRALDDVSFTLQPGEILGIVGESGSGKSTLLRQIACLEHLDSGELLLDGRDVTHAAPRDVCRRVQLVFQDAAASFDPRRTVRQSLYEPLRLLGGEPDPAARVTELLRQVGVPEELADRRPAQLSGGQCQRMAIARALAARPAALLCDEVTSALDVSAQAQIVRLLASLRAGLGLAIVFVSHDLALVSSLCDRAMVLQGGRCVEQGAANALITNPQEPYTRRLRESVLTLDALRERERKA
ncbi:MAG: ATP-binding cassette domain-containing protein [Clostridiales bacterium]|nr:ATP-binding cassette domain-containing protein [Clostridiales bacterium]MDY6094871.1 ATP-binding cassette domain-containing protein [Oscillospiraceae bacterium]